MNKLCEAEHNEKLNLKFFVFFFLIEKIAYFLLIFLLY